MGWFGRRKPTGDRASEKAPAAHLRALQDAGSAGMNLVNHVIATPDALLAIQKRLMDDELIALHRAVNRDAFTAFEYGAPMDNVGAEARRIREALGPKVIINALNETWSFGYRMGLARLFIENESLGRMPPHEWRSTPMNEMRPIYDALEPIWLDRPEWMSYAALAPFTSDLLFSGLLYLSEQVFKRIAPLYAEGYRERAGAMMTGITVGGYAAGRAQQETAAMNAFLGLPI